VIESFRNIFAIPDLRKRLAFMFVSRWEHAVHTGCDRGELAFVHPPVDGARGQAQGDELLTSCVSTLPGGETHHLSHDSHGSEDAASGGPMEPSCRVPRSQPNRGR
jgi:hypothetical protein